MQKKKFLAKKSLVLLLLVVFVGSLVSPLGSVKSVSAAGGPAVAPPVSQPSNTLHQIAQTCHDFKDLGSNNCEAWQNQLKGAIGCTDLFYQAQNNPADPSAKGLWYTDPQAFKDCYDKAAAEVSNLGQSTCTAVQVNPPSANYDKCRKYQDHLVTALGCNGKMYDVPKSGLGTLNQGKYAACQSNLRQVGNFKLTIIDANGNRATDTNPVSSTTAQAVGSAVSTGAASGKAGPTCDSDGFSLNWILCPIIQGLSNAIDGIFKDLIFPLLTTTPINLTDPSQDKTHAYQVWSNFRVYGDIFLVIALLVIVFGESIGGGMIDAYTAKKVLPRLLLAAILINLSIYLVSLALDITNIIGNGISSLITAPFHGQGISNGFDLHISGAASGIGMAAIVGGVIWGTVLAGGFLHFLFLGLLLPAVLLFLAIFVTVIIRQALILILLFVSPIAFALYCLPNTEQYFRKWWNLLFRTLMVFPIIAAIFAIANVLSVTINVTAKGQLKDFTEIFSAFALFAPLILVPLSFRFAGGILGQIHNAARQGVNPALNSMKKARSAKRAEAMAKAQNFSRYSDRTAIGRGMNTAIGAVANPKSMLRGRRGVSAARSARQTAAGGDILKNSPIAQSNSGDDAFWLAIANEGLAKQKIDKARKRSFDTSLSDNERASAQREVDSRERALDNARQMGPARLNSGVRSSAFMELAKTGYQFAPGEQGYNELRATARDISGGDERAFTGLMDQSQYHLKNAGRGDLAGLNHGAGADIKSGVRKQSNYQRGQGKPDTYLGGAEGWLGKGVIDDKGKTSHASLVNAMNTNLKNGTITHDDIAEWHSMLLQDKSSATDANKIEIQKQLGAIETFATEGAGGDVKTDSLEQMQHNAGLKARIDNNYNELRRGLTPEQIDQANKS